MPSKDTRNGKFCWITWIVGEHLVTMICLLVSSYLRVRRHPILWIRCRFHYRYVGLFNVLSCRRLGVVSLNILLKCICNCWKQTNRARNFVWDSHQIRNFILALIPLSWFMEENLLLFWFNNLNSALYCQLYRNPVSSFESLLCELSNSCIQFSNTTTD